jgi:outer membrane protein assembly factor BamB
MFILACGLTSNLPSARTPSNNNNIPTKIITSAPITTSTSITTSTPERSIIWNWNASQFLFNWAGLRLPNYYPTDNNLHFLSDEYKETNQPRLFYPKVYYYDETTLYAPNINQQISAIDINTGNLLWQSDLTGYVIGLGLNSVLVYTKNNRIYGLDKSNGKEEWKIIIGLLLSENQESSPFPFSQEFQGEIIIPMNSGCGNYNNLRFLHITDETTGENWLSDCNPDYEAEPGTILAFVDGIFITTNSRWDGFENYANVTGYDPHNGSIIWKVEENAHDLLNIRIREFNTENKILYIQSYHNSGLGEGVTDLLAIDVVSGDLVWGKGIFQLNGLDSYLRPNTYTNFFLTKKLVYYYSDNEILVFQKNDGLLINKIPIERKFTPFFSENGMIVYYPELGIAQGIDPLSQDILWENDEFPSPNTERSLDNWNYNYYEDLIIFNLNGTSELFAVDQKSGDELWRSQIECNSCDMILINKFGGSLIIGNVNDLWLMDLHSGDIRLANEGRSSTTDGIFIIETLDENSWILNYRHVISLINVK